MNGSKKQYSRTVTFFGSYCSTISFIFRILDCANLERSVTPWSCAVSSLNMSSANSTREASCRSALLRVQFVTACNSSSVTFRCPSSPRKLVRDKCLGSTTRCTKGISKLQVFTHPSQIKRNFDIHSTHQHKKRQVTATLN